MIVRKGDIVTVRIPTYWDLLAQGPNGPNALQARLQQAGFRVIKIDNAALGAWGVISGRQDLLITIASLTSDYASEQDVAGLVAGAAYAVGYDINAGAAAIVIAQAGTNADAYNQNQQVAPKNPSDVSLDLDKFFADYGTPLLIGGALLVTLFLLKK